MHEDNFYLHNDFGLADRSEGKPHGVCAVCGGNDREWTESNVHIEFMHSDWPGEGVYLHDSDVDVRMGMREVFISGVQLLEDGFDICDFLYQWRKRIGDWS